jgi:hypothetical protein
MVPLLGQFDPSGFAGSQHERADRGIRICVGAERPPGIALGASRLGTCQCMTTTPSEPVQDPDVVPSGDPHREPDGLPEWDPDQQPPETDVEPGDVAEASSDPKEDGKA